MTRKNLNLGHTFLADHYRTVNRAAYWGGKSETGETRPSGIYFYQLQTGNYTETRKMMSLK